MKTFKEFIQEESKSPAQQKLFGMAWAHHNKELDDDFFKDKPDLKEKLDKIVKSFKKSGKLKHLQQYAKTPHSEMDK